MNDQNPADVDWDAMAKKLGVESGAILKDQVDLADDVIREILQEEESK